ncbi:MAG: T9SS type A sorting domain-containing protein [Bacteroidia bacterium]|nr:T9SS type A sorting domain-containing protein [Bacteroidia bacterium]
MKKHYLISAIILLFAGVGAHAQPYETNPDYKRANIWYFGDSAGIDFSSGSPVSLTNSKMYALEASGTIADTNGNLLFYTNGQTVWNKNHEIMEGGNGLEGSQDASQNGLILNHPDNDSLYYIFLTPYSYDYMNGLKYCVVNIKANNGNGKVSEKNILLHPNSSEKVSAVYHANGRDIWIIGHEWGNNNFYLYLLTSNGFNQCPVINSVGIQYKKSSIFTDGIFVNQGFIKFSPNSKYMAHVFTPTDPLNIFSELYRFDKTNGHLELFTTIPNDRYLWGAEFSDNSENLFICRRDSPVLVYNIPTNQYRMIDSLILPSATQLQLSNDGNIYFGLADSTFIGIINGNDFNNIHINKKAVNLSKGTMQYGLPNIFVGYLTHGQPRIIYEDKCSNQTFDFGLSYLAANVTKWIFTHPNNEFERTEDNPTVTFPDTGLWTVKCVLLSNDTLSTTLFAEAQIPHNFLGNDTGWCEELGASLTLQAPSGMHCYEWNTGETASQISADTTGIYIAKITTPNFCIFYDTIAVSIDTTPPKPVIYQNHDTLKTDVSAKGYQWYKDNNPTGENNNFLKITDTGIYRLTITSNAGCVAQSDTLNVFRVGVKGVERLDFKVYPNPFTDELIIELKEDKKPEIIIFNSLGQEILKTTLTNTIERIHTAKWKQGVYFMEVTQQNGIKQIIKLIKTE